MAKISVITPTYNRPDMIGRAIKSVLAQTFSDWEDQAEKLERIFERHEIGLKT